MQPKDSKNYKKNNSHKINTLTKNKKEENNIQINKILFKSKTSKGNIDQSTQEPKNQENKINKIGKNYNLENKSNINDKNKEKKNNKIKYQTKTSNDKSSIKNNSSIKTKIINKIKTGETRSRKNTMKNKKYNNIFEPKKNTIQKTKTISINEKRSMNINDEDKYKEDETGYETKRLLKLLTSLYPIDNNKCNNLAKNNLGKIIQLENKIKEIIIQTSDEVEVITNKEKQNLNKSDDEDNQISLEQNIVIINKESKMRKDIYNLLFDFIKQILEQINKLSYNIANQELKELNTFHNNDNIFLINNNSNVSLESHNSLFVSEIQDDFCNKLNNIARSFINSDIDLSSINFKNNDDINFKNFDDNLFNDDDDFKDYKNLLTNKNKKPALMHPNEILDKIKNEDKKEKMDKKINHHYSNSLKIYSNLEKLEAKINKNNDDINNTQQIENTKDMIQKNNCLIF